VNLLDEDPFALSIQKITFETLRFRFNPN